MAGKVIIELRICGLRSLDHLLPIIITFFTAAILSPPALAADNSMVQYLLSKFCRHLLSIVLLMGIREKSLVVLQGLGCRIREFHWMLLLVSVVLLHDINLWLLLLLLRFVYPLILIWWNLLLVLLVTRLKIGRLKLIGPVINIDVTDFAWQGICYVRFGENIRLDPYIVVLGTVLEWGGRLSRTKLSKLSLCSILIHMRYVWRTVLILDLIVHIELEVSIWWTHRLQLHALSVRLCNIGCLKLALR